MQTCDAFSYFSGPIDTAIDGLATPGSRWDRAAWDLSDMFSASSVG